MKLNRVLSIAAITLFASASYADLEINIKNQPKFEQQYLLSKGQTVKLKIMDFQAGDKTTCSFPGDKGLQLANLASHTDAFQAFKAAPSPSPQGYSDATKALFGIKTEATVVPPAKAYTFDSTRNSILFDFGNSNPKGVHFTVDVTNSGKKSARLMVVCETERAGTLHTTMPF